jgi:hypothetical protein
MIGALVFKELRESVGIAALGLLALFAIAAGNMGMSPLPGLIGPLRQGQIPFLDDSFLYQFGFVSSGLAIALGLKQSVGDLMSDAALFVLHRPVSRARIYATKLCVGLAIYVLLSGGTVLAYAIWAALPGTHASPFDWQMTWTAWMIVLAMTSIYLAAFLTGIRPAAWVGTRLCPLVASGLIVFLALILPVWLACWGLIAIDLVFAALILDIAETRDFA